MKTKEELNALKEKVEKINEEIAELSGDEQKARADEIDGKLMELNEEELKEVTAGMAYGAGTYAYTVFIHKNCGGEIMNVGNPFSSCYCDKCGETHYWHYSFEYTKVNTKD